MYSKQYSLAGLEKVKRAWCLTLNLCASWRLLYTRSLEVVRCKEAMMRSHLCIVSVLYVRRVSANFKMISGRYTLRLSLKSNTLCEVT